MGLRPSAVWPETCSIDYTSSCSKTGQNPRPSSIRESSQSSFIHGYRVWKLPREICTVRPDVEQYPPLFPSCHSRSLQAELASAQETEDRRTSSRAFSYFGLAVSLRRGIYHLFAVRISMRGQSYTISSHNVPPLRSTHAMQLPRLRYIALYRVIMNLRYNLDVRRLPPQYNTHRNKATQRLTKQDSDLQLASQLLRTLNVARCRLRHLPAIPAPLLHDVACGVRCCLQVFGVFKSFPAVPTLPGSIWQQDAALSPSRRSIPRNTCIDGMRRRRRTVVSTANRKGG
ncbi:hypothetical protein BV25DRAFT_1136630 [Artomyces pyxidatus]|uniref:Uncharacterized protein n=1 Tax=Artomyces pyxidatus TaxID=48021 RepID=A0ACB8SST8_9AGAM|nr:hypothetical protein BV25DRAFT_1136630 [Artomyces pyxidatus]